MGVMKRLAGMSRSSRASGIKGRKKSGAAGMQFLVTGDKELDKALKRLPIKLQTKYMKKATRKGANLVRDVFRATLLAVDTGALRDKVSVKAAYRKDKKTKELQVGAKVHLDRKRIINEREDRGGDLGWDNKRNEPFFYPAVIEYATYGDKPLRSALYGAEAAVRRLVIAEAKALIRNAQKEGKSRL